MSLKQNKTKLNVNLGCGSQINEGKDWLNIDNYLITDAPNFLQADIRKLPLQSESVDYIICDQVLEHIPMKDIPTVLFEVRRVLKKGGRAVIIVPDFEGAVRQWLSVDHNKTFNPFIYHWLSEVIYGNQNHEGEYHKTAMSAGFLNYTLNMVGLPKHELIIYPENSPIPVYPGMRPYAPNAILRNSQLVADIIKE